MWNWKLVLFFIQLFVVLHISWHSCVRWAKMRHHATFYGDLLPRYHNLMVFKKGTVCCLGFLKIFARPLLKRFTLCYRTYLSVTLMYCGQTVGWIRMPLSIEVGLGPGHIVLDGELAPPKRGTARPSFLPMSVVAKQLDGSRCHFVRR